MHSRSFISSLRSMVHDRPIVAVVGSRHAGKAELCRTLFPEKGYVTFQWPEAVESAKREPEAFLARYPGGAIIDELHRCPEITDTLVDMVRSGRLKGSYILISPIESQRLSEYQRVFPHSFGLFRIPLLTYTEISETEAGLGLDQVLLRGSYPAVQSSTAFSPWHREFLINFLERDLKHVINVREPEAFWLFLRSCAAAVGRYVNLSELAAPSKITHNTAKAWLTALESAHLLYQLWPCSETFGRRTVKAPRLYFRDTGLACNLIGLDHIRTPSKSSSFPGLFTSFVISELQRTRYNSGAESRLFYWSDSAGNSIDLLAERGAALLPLMICPSSSVAELPAASIAKWRKLNKQPNLPAAIIYSGETHERVSGINIYPWHEIGELASLFCGGLKSYMRGQK